jgi:hypothetical protein
MAEANLWTEIDKFTMPTSNFTASFFAAKRRAEIPWESIVSIINTTNGPVDELKKYLKLVEDADERLKLAINYKVHEVVIEVFLFIFVVFEIYQ